MNNELNSVPLVNGDMNRVYMQNGFTNNDQRRSYNVEDFHAKEFRGARDQKNGKLFPSNKIIAISIAVTLAASIGINVVSDMQMREATSVAYEFSLPREFSPDTKVVVQKNGDAYYERADGTKFATCNGLSAKDAASQMQTSKTNINESGKVL